MMSTKCTRKFAEIEGFKLHLYDDFGGSPAVEVWMNDAHAILLVSKEELDSLDKQLTGKQNG